LRIEVCGLQSCLRNLAVFFFPLSGGGGDEGEQALYTDTELPLRRALVRVERHGVLVDSAALLAQGEELGGRMRDIEGRAYTLAGEQFNLASPKQIAAVLFGTSPEAGG
jgi:DNA polymerase I-like protein with 3'-5' exonuclease and polymerase domains